MNETSLNPFALLFLLGASLVILGSSRQNAVKAMLATALFMPLGQQVVLAGLHLYFSRILIMVGLARLLVHGEMKDFRWTSVDKFFVAWALTEFVMRNLRDGVSDAFVSAAGNAYNELGIYFFVRLLIKDVHDIIVQIRFLAVAVVILAVIMIPELTTGRNPFYVLGGVPLISEVRERGIRCQGSFRDSILAGTFGATLFPLMIGLWLQGGRGKWRVIPAIMACIFIVYASASSGPLLSSVSVVISFGLWRMRNKMHLIRRGMVLTLIVLAMVMKAPVWYLIDRVSSLAGGGGWHRSYLIDQFVQHFNEWWLMGTSVTKSWAPAGMTLTVDPNNMDITNEFVVHGVQGGILGLFFFLAFIVCCFKIIGRSVRSGGTGGLEAKTVWAIGACLVAHCASFVSISYFDQIVVFWFWLLAVVSCLDIAQSAVTDSVPDNSLGTTGRDQKEETGSVAPV